MVDKTALIGPGRWHVVEISGKRKAFQIASQAGRENLVNQIDAGKMKYVSNHKSREDVHAAYKKRP